MIEVKFSYPDVLQVQGNISDKRLDESLLKPESLFSLIKCFIFNLKKKKFVRFKRVPIQNTHIVFS